MIKQIFPPIIWSFLSYINKKIIRNKENMSDVAWHEINKGPLAGRKIFGDSKSEWFSTILSGQYDTDLFDNLEHINLSGKTVVEVGAHIGYHTMVFAKKVGENGRIFAFEPNPYNKDRLIKNLDENRDLSERIEVKNIALSDKCEQEEFVFGNRVDKGSSSGSFLERSDTIWEKHVYEEEKIGFKKMLVSTQTLDELRTNGTIPNRITLCKIDVEGGEYLVLSGAIKTLRNDRPILLIEIHSIFNMWKITEIFKNEKYNMNILKKEPDGRCFFMLTPTNKEVK